MKSNKALLLPTLAAFCGGFVAGVLFQTDTCRELRTSLGNTARDRTRWLEDRFGALENQISQIEEQLHQLGDDFGQRVREVVHSHVPDIEGGRERWQVEDREVERDLPRMPKS